MKSFKRKKSKNWCHQCILLEYCKKYLEIKKIKNIQLTINFINYENEISSN